MRVALKSFCFFGSAVVVFKRPIKDTPPTPQPNPAMPDTNINISEAAQRVVALLKDHKGQFITAEWMSEPKPLAAHKGKVLRKFSKATVRTGVSFANLTAVKDAIEAGERGEVGSLPDWQEWGLFPFILRHKGNGTEYLRLTLVDGSPIVSRYEVDGVEVDAATFYAMLPKQSGERPLIISIKLANLVSIG